MLYTIIRCSCQSELIKIVTNYIQEGWRPLGGATVLNLPSGVCFYQTLTKDV